MKSTFLLLTTLFLLGSLFSQENNYPLFNLINLDGESISSQDVLEHEQPTILVFWKSNSPNCCDNLDNMQTAWLDELKDKNVRFIAVCVDCNGNWSRIKPFVYGKNWDFEVYIDVNGDCRRAMEITTTPFTIVFDENQQIVCSYAGYCKGNEELLCSKILHLLNMDNDNLISKSEY